MINTCALAPTAGSGPADGRRLTQSRGRPRRGKAATNATGTLRTSGGDARAGRRAAPALLRKSW